jgi:hypothetical protein
MQSADPGTPGGASLLAKQVPSIIGERLEAGRGVALGMRALKRLGKPEDDADVVPFVSSDAA